MVKTAYPLLRVATLVQGVHVSTSFELAIHVNIAILFFHQIQKVNLQQVLHVETLGNAAIRSSRT